MDTKKECFGGRRYMSPELVERHFYVESGFCTSKTGESFSDSGKVYDGWGYEPEN